MTEAAVRPVLDLCSFNPRGISPEQAMSGLLARIDALSLATSGTFWLANGEVLPW